VIWLNTYISSENQLKINLKEDIMLKLSILFMCVVISGICAELCADRIANEVYQALPGKDVIITSADGMEVHYSFLKDYDDKIVVTDSEGEIIVIQKNDIEHIKVDKPQRRDADLKTVVVKNSYGVNIVKKISDEQLKERNRLFALHEETYREGRRMNRTGKAMLIPGWIMTGIGVYVLAVTYASESDNGFYADDSKGLMRLGGVLSVIGIPLTIGGHVVKAKGNKKLELAKQYKDQSQRISYQVKPIVNPISDSYGVSLNFTF